MQEIKIDHFIKWYMQKPKSVPENEMGIILSVFRHKGITHRLQENQTLCWLKEIRTCHLIDFAIPVDHKAKL